MSDTLFFGFLRMNLNAIALGRCEKLLSMAKEIYGDEPELSNRYVDLARKIAMRHRLHLGRKVFCKKCSAIFIQGKTLKVRVSKEKKATLYTCMACNTTFCFPYSKEKRVDI